MIKDILSTEGDEMDMSEKTESESNVGEKTESESNVVFIGRKPVMAYVVECVAFFNQGVKEVILKARGSAISTTVDVVELLRRAFVKDLIIKNIAIGTDTVDREGRKSNISTIEINIEKPSA